MKRNNVKQITIRLTADEYAHVKQLSKDSGLKMEPAIRRLIMGVNLRPRPPDAYADLLRALSAIGNNINQLAHQANTRGTATGDEITEALRLVREKLGDRARFTTPLLRTPRNAAKTVWMCRRAELLYIKVYDGGTLQLAEVVPAESDVDLVYFFERLGGVFALKEFELRIAGDNSKMARKLLGKRFKQTVCE